MKTLRKTVPPRVSAITRSREVQYGRKRVGLMFRRGLHGAKNWVLEPDKDGTPRSVRGKLGRLVVVLLPVWIVLSATTGETGQGDQSASVAQSILTALIVTLVGLGVFSARERRLGREEPWELLPQVTAGDDCKQNPQAVPAPEEPTEGSAKPQVSEVTREAGGGEGVVTPGDITDVSDQSSQDGPEMVTPMVSHRSDRIAESSFAQAERGYQGGKNPAGAVTAMETGGLEEAANRRIPDSLEAGSPVGAPAGGNPLWEPVTVSLEKGESAQVNAGMGVETPLSSGDSATVTLSDGEVAPVRPVRTFAPPVSAPVQGELFPQVTPGEGLVTQAPPPAMATPGPYRVTDGPLSEDWWLTKPDVEREEASRPDAEPVSEEGAPMSTPTEEAVKQPAEAAEQPEVPFGRNPAVLLYLALQGMPDASEEEKAEAKEKVVEVARSEIDAGRETRRSVGRVLGVSHVTIGKWLGQGDPEYDPWAEGQEVR